MKKLIDKLILAELAMARVRGPFTLFSLIKRDEEGFGWDLVVSAEWLNDAGLAELRFISEQLKLKVGESGMVEIGRIVPLDTKDRFVQAILKDLPVEGAWTEVHNVTVGKTKIDHAIIFTSARRDKAAPATARKIRA